MKDEIKERLEKGCGRKFSHINGYSICGEKELCQNCYIKILQHEESFKAGMNASRKMCWKLGEDAERKRILEILKNNIEVDACGKDIISGNWEELINEAVKE